MVNILPKIYRKHLIYEKKRTVLYFTLNKALYSSLLSELIFYERLVAYMRVKGFEINLH